MSGWITFQSAKLARVDQFSVGVDSQLANREGLVRLKQLKSVLTSGRDQLPASPLSYPELPQEHENIRGPQSFH